MCFIETRERAADGIIETTAGVLSGAWRGGEGPTEGTRSLVRPIRKGEDDQEGCRAREEWPWRVMEENNEGISGGKRKRGIKGVVSEIQGA